MIILKILCVLIFRKNEQLSLFWPKFTQKCITWSEFQKSRCGFRISTSKIPCVPIFNFEFFHLNLGKLRNYMSYFGSNNVEGVAKNSVEAEMSWLEVGLLFSDTLKFINYTSNAISWQKTVL